MNYAIVLAPKQSVTNMQAIFWGGLVAGTLDAVDGVIAYGTQGLNPIQVLHVAMKGRFTMRLLLTNRTTVIMPFCSGSTQTLLESDGRKPSLYFDSTTMTCTEDAEANSMFTREYRAPFVVPKIA